MPRIRCHYEDCVFLEDKYCGAAQVELDPDTGCMTYSLIDEPAVPEAEEKEWEEELVELIEEDEDDEEEDLYGDEEDDDDDDDDDD